MAKTLGEIIKRCISLSKEPGPTGETIFLDANQIVGGDILKIIENVFELTPEIQKVLSSSACAGKSIKNDSDFLIFDTNIKDLVYRGNGDESSNRNFFL